MIVYNNVCFDFNQFIVNNRVNDHIKPRLKLLKNPQKCFRIFSCSLQNRILHYHSRLTINSHNFSFVRHVFVKILDVFGNDENDPIMNLNDPENDKKLTNS